MLVWFGYLAGSLGLLSLAIHLIKMNFDSHSSAQRSPSPEKDI